jgi:hypothetical protein
MYEAAQLAAIIGAAPAITPIADEALKSAGYVEPPGGTPQVLGPGVQQQTGPGMSGPGVPQPAIPVLQQADGAQRGIETARPDGGVPQ